jgi:hypothetical protein
MVDGLELRLLEETASSGAELGRAFRGLARMMVRSYADERDQTAITDECRSFSKLTVVRHPRPDHDTNEAA